MGFRTQRIRDPIHDLIIFEESEPLDQTAWSLIQTPEFQRLRRIKQLGVTEFVFPGATHSRFAHSIGVFHNARRILRLIRREIKLGRVAGDVNPERETASMLAALLHDLGHGPFSHAFEEARKKIAKKRAGDGSEPKIDNHEAWTAKIIQNPEGPLFDILEKEKDGLAAEIAHLVNAEIPDDMYHAVVSSSFDADRLDYLERDRYMTGTGSGAIDLIWLFDNVRVADIDFAPPSDDTSQPVHRHSFCLGYKAREAAEDFLLARYRLFTTVYLHKTTRGIEQMLAAVFQSIADVAEAGNSEMLGLGDDHPLVLFFSPDGETLDNYLALDDTVVWGAIERLKQCRDERLANIASRILSREKPFAIDVQTAFPDDAEQQRRAQRQLDEIFHAELGSTVFRDEAKLTLYGEIGADDTQAQKRLMIQLPNDRLKEITHFRDSTIRGSSQPRRFVRYYFLNESDYTRACEAIQGGS